MEILDKRDQIKHIGNDVTIREYVVFVRPENIFIANHVMIDSFTVLAGGYDVLTEIGNYVHIACFSSIDGRGGVTMRDFSGISAGCRLFTSDDDYVNGALINPTVPPELRNVRIAHITLERFATLGANCVVLPGVTIGEGAVVGACSLVKEDLEPWTVNAGVPATQIKRRNRERVLQRFERLRSNNT